MDFGLGLILSFTDNATAGINSAIGSLGMLESTVAQTSNSMTNLSKVASLSALSAFSNQLGSSLSGVGNSIIGMFSNASNSIIDVGSRFQSLRITLKALLQDEDKAKEALDNLMNFAATTPFEIDELTGIYSTLIASKNDPFKEMISSSGQVKTNLMSVIGDLKAFKPSVQADKWALAIANAVSGETKVLRNILDIGDLDTVLGRKFGKSGDFAKDMMDLVENANLLGLMGSNMDTMNQSLANMSDQFTRIKLAIADAGVFDTLQRAVINVTSAIGSIKGEELEAVASSLAGALQTVISPVTRLTELIGKSVVGIAKFIAQNPKLIKVFAVITAITGGALVAIGTVLKLTSALSGVFLLLLTLKQLNVGGIGGMIAMGFGSMISVLVTVATVVGAFALAWNTNFANIQTFTVSVINGVIEAFSIANNAVNGAIINMIRTVNTLDTTTFSGGLAMSIMKAWILLRAFVETWNGYTLNDDTFLKAQELGILPLIEGFLRLKRNFEYFCQGFVEGFTQVGDMVSSVIDKIQGKLNLPIFDKIGEKIREIFTSLAVVDKDKFSAIGESVGKFGTLIAGGILLAIPAIKLLALAFNPVIGVIGLVISSFTGLLGFTSIGSLLSASFLGLGSAVTAGLNGLPKVLSVVFGGLSSFTGGVGRLVALVISEFGAMVAHAGTFAGGLWLAFSYVLGFIPLFGDKLVALLGNAFAGVGFLGNIFTKSFGFVYKTFNFLWAHALDFALKWMPRTFNLVFGTIPALGGKLFGILSNVFGGPLFSKVFGLLSSAFSGLGKIMPIISSVFGKIGGVILSVLKLSIGGIPLALILAIGLGITALIAYLSNNSGSIAEVFQKLWDKLPSGVQDALVNVGTKVKEFFMTISDKLGLTPIIEKIASGFMNILPKIVEFGNGVISAVTKIAGWASSFFTGVIIPIFSTVVSAVKSMWDSWLKELLLNIVGFAKIVGTVIGGIIDYCMTNIVPVVVSIVKTIIKTFTSIVNSVGTIVNGIIQLFKGVIQFFQGIFSGDLDKAWEGIKNIFVGAWNVIKGIFSGVGSYFVGVVKVIKDTFKGVATVVGDVVSAIIKKSINAVIGMVCTKINSIIRAINFASGIINKIPGVSIPKIDEVTAPKFAKGGVVDKATLGIFGEAGTEAVVPLERNTEWISKVAGDLADNMKNNNTDFSPLVAKMGAFINSADNATTRGNVTVATPSNNNPMNTNSNSYMTSTNNNVTQEGNVDNSIVFERESIVVKVESAKQEDIEVLAERLMAIIERKKRIKQRLSYN